MKSLKSRRDEAVRQAKITFKTGYTCPDVAITEVVETIAKQTFDAAISELKPEIDALVKALEFTLEVTELAGADHYSAKWIAGSGFSNKAQYLAGHNENKTKLSRQALTKYKAFMGDGE